MYIFDPQPNVTIFIIIWIKYGMKQKFSSILLKCLVKSFACKIRNYCQINLTSQFSIRTLMFLFYVSFHTCNTLLVDNTPHKNMFNGPYSGMHSKVAHFQKMFHYLKVHTLVFK